jgi:hypothetical protein
MDPFHGLIVWGTLGLLGWFATAAVIGAGLRLLGVWSQRRPATRGADAEFSDAA